VGRKCLNKTPEELRARNAKAQRAFYKRNRELILSRNREKIGNPRKVFLNDEERNAAKKLYRKNYYKRNRSKLLSKSIERATAKITRLKFLENLCEEKQKRISELELKVAQQGLRIGELLKEKNNGNG